MALFVSCQTVPANTLLDFMGKEKSFEEPVRKVLGGTLSNPEGKVSESETFMSSRHV